MPASWSLRQSITSGVQGSSAVPRGGTAGQSGAAGDRTGAGAHRALELEIAQEMALALGRSAEHVMVAISAIERADQALRAASEAGADPAEIEVLCADARLARTRAGARLWELVVHREALGLFDHSILQRFYPIPPLRQT